MSLKNLTPLFHNLKIKYKLFLAYFLITIIPISLIGYFTYQSSVNYHRQQSMNILIQLQHNTITNIQSRHERYRFLIDTIYNNNKMWDFISGNYMDYYEEYLLINNFVEPVLQSLLNSTGRGICISLIRYDESKNEIIPGNFEGIQNNSTDGNNMVAEGRKFYQVINSKRLQNEAWFLELDGFIDDYVWLQLGKDREYDNVSLVREVVNYIGSSKDKTGFIRLTVQLTDILGEEKIDSTVDSGFSLIFDQDNNLLSFEREKVAFYRQNADIITKYLDQSNNKNAIFMDQWIFLKDEVSVNGWNMISVFPSIQFTHEMDRIGKMTVLYVIISIVFLFIVTFWLSNYFSSRITRIARHVERIMKGSFDINPGRISKDEIGLLAAGINDMTMQINSLIHDNYQANIEKKDAELRALQAQINPHFLYNSMSAIDRLADLSEINGIKSMVDALVRFYRMTLNKGRDVITVQDEIEQVKAYIDVMLIRKSEYFSILYDVDEDILKYYTIKVILQPFVENVFEHALSFRENPINIKISAKQVNSSIEFKIIDDGIGISRERLNNLCSDKPGSPRSSGYGIKNVEERIKMYYGSACMVRIYSLRGAGTTVLIQIPISKSR